MSETLPKILVCGMPRSMTTWAFNIVRELIVADAGDFIWIAPGSPQEAQFAGSRKVVLAKCHHFTRGLAAAADVVIYSYRDIRTAAVSYHRKFNSPCTREMMDNWVAAEADWLGISDIALRYEDVEGDPLQTVAALRALLNRKAPELSLTPRDDAQVLAAVDKTFREIQVTTEVKYDAATMILPAHRTFQPEPEQLAPEERALYDRVGSDFSAWLASHCYLDASDLGQQLEYRIAGLVLSAFERPTVIDVGVGRGSFIDLALRADSASVIGFEPLPRHLENLARRFAAEPRVRIHAIAASSRGGSAALHIATDTKGNELDSHHSLDDLGDSPTIIRSQRTIQVRTAALGELVREGIVPQQVDFLKIDTDGHDLEVLNGLGGLRPRAIIARYSDTLPESNGRNPFTLAQLGAWAGANRYPRMVVVRRHGRVELVQFGGAWSIAGDWGNVILFGEHFDFAAIEARLQEHERASYEALCSYVTSLMRETDANEGEIRRLDAALQEARAPASEGSGGLMAQLEAKEAVIQDLLKENATLDAALQGLRALGSEGPGGLIAQLEAKEAVIQDLLKANARNDSQHRRAPTDAADRQNLNGARQAKLALDAQEKDALIGSLNERIILLHEDQARLGKTLQDKEVLVHGLLKSMAHAEQQQQQELLRSTQQTEVANRDVAAVMNPQVHAILARELEEKEVVIQEMKKALDSYRAAFGLLGFFLRPLTRLIPLSLFSGMVPRPRLGTLNQHGPQKLVIPPSYSRPPTLALAPKISLVTPSFKQAAFIERTLRSVLDQNYPNLEYHVQDGGSEDGTREILERHADRLASWESRPDSGQSQAINLGFARVSGEIMGWLNSDDILLPGALHKVAEFFNRNPDVDVIYGHRLLIDENDRMIGRWILPAHNDTILSWADYVPQETLFWRRPIWEKAGGKIDESFRFAMDWDLLLRFRDAGARFARINRFMGGFRIHPHQKTSAAIGEIGFKEMDRLRERSLGRVPTHSEVRRAVMPYLLRHVACELGWRVRAKLGGHR